MNLLSLFGIFRQPSPWRILHLPQRVTVDPRWSLEKIRCAHEIGFNAVVLTGYDTSDLPVPGRLLDAMHQHLTLCDQLGLAAIVQTGKWTKSTSSLDANDRTFMLLRHCRSPYNVGNGNFLIGPASDGKLNRKRIPIHFPSDKINCLFRIRLGADRPTNLRLRWSIGDNIETSKVIEVPDALDYPRVGQIYLPAPDYQDWSLHFETFSEHETRIDYEITECEPSKDSFAETFEPDWYRWYGTEHNYAKGVAPRYALSTTTTRFYRRSREIDTAFRRHVSYRRGGFHGGCDEPGKQGWSEEEKRAAPNTGRLLYDFVNKQTLYSYALNGRPTHIWGDWCLGQNAIQFARAVNPRGGAFKDCYENFTGSERLIAWLWPDEPLRWMLEAIPGLKRILSVGDRPENADKWVHCINQTPPSSRTNIAGTVMYTESQAACDDANLEACMRGMRRIEAAMR